MNDSFELPSLEEIQEMEKQHSLAIEALDISNDSVKCQRFGISLPMLRALIGSEAIESMLCKNRSSGLKNIIVSLIVHMAISIIVVVTTIKTIITSSS